MSHKLFLRLFCLLLGFGTMLHTANAQLVGGTSNPLSWGGTPTVIVDTTTTIQAHWDSTSSIQINGTTAELYHVWLQQLQNGVWQTAGHYYTTDAEWVYQEPLPNGISRLVVVPFNMIGGQIIENPLQTQSSESFYLNSARRWHNIVIVDINRTANPATSTCQTDRILFQTALDSPSLLKVKRINSTEPQTLAQFTASLSNTTTILPVQVRLRNECTIGKISDKQDYIIQENIRPSLAGGISLLQVENAIRVALRGALPICKAAGITTANGQVILIEANQ